MKNHLPEYLQPMQQGWRGASHPTTFLSTDEAKLIKLYTGHATTAKDGDLIIRAVTPAGSPPITVTLLRDSGGIETKSVHGSNDFASFKEWRNYIDGWRNKTQYVWLRALGWRYFTGGMR